MDERIAFVLDKELKSKIENRAKELGLSSIASYLRMLALADLKKVEKGE